VADRVERAGGWLRDSDGDAILRDVEDFGRRNPLAVAAGGLAVGFALSRLLKASSRDRYESSGGTTTRFSRGNGHAAGTLPRAGATTPAPGATTGAGTTPATGAAPRAGGVEVPDLPQPPRP
jgi:hypothetical protein